MTIILSATCLLRRLPISRLHGKEAKEPRINSEIRVHKAEQGFVSCKFPERLYPGGKGNQNETRPSKDWLDQDDLFLMYLQSSRKVNPLWRKNIIWSVYNFLYVTSDIQSKFQACREIEPRDCKKREQEKKQTIETYPVHYIFKINVIDVVKNTDGKLKNFIRELKFIKKDTHRNFRNKKIH